MLSPITSSKGGRFPSTTSSKGGSTADRGTHPFLSDFFRTDIMNHCEFLKQLNELGPDDAYLIAEICERLVNQTNGKDAEPITPFYGGGDAVEAKDVGHIARADFQKHKSFPRNCYNIIMVYASLTKLKGHEYNIYELAYLNYHSRFSFRLAILIFVIQFLLLLIVLHANLKEYETAFLQRDPFVLVIDLCTSIFFAIFCFGQFDSSRTFTTAARGVIGSYLVKDEDLVIKIQNPTQRGKWQPELMMFFNELVNQYALVLAPIFNFYFILLSGSAMDALLNSFSLLFIFELDDYVLPLFEGVDIEDKLVINAHDFIMVQPVTEDLRCRRTAGPALEEETKLYVSVQKGDKSINIYSRVSATEYAKTTYAFEGPQATKFLAMCDEALICLQNFKDIHD